MLQITNGIVLRSIKYGDTSLICNIFTRQLGVQTYLLQGVRSSKAQNKAALFQPATLLEIVAYQKPQKNLQRLKEYRAAYLAANMQQEVVKNSIALFSVELLLKLLPEHAPLPELFDFCFDYFVSLDKLPVQAVGNLPLFFASEISKHMGFDLTGHYSTATPHLNLEEGGFSEHPPREQSNVSDHDAKELELLRQVQSIDQLQAVAMSSASRFRLLEWYIAFLQRHTQHMGQLKSLAILKTILH